MGNWRITIEGTGVHHNGTIAVLPNEEKVVAILNERKREFSIRGKEIWIRGGVPYELSPDVLEWIPAVPEDANVKCIEFVKSLKDMGHQINGAKFEVLSGQVDYVKV